MPLYEFQCWTHGRFSEHRPFEESGEPGVCPECDQSTKRVFGDFVFVEDRTRLYRNPRTGTRFSDVLGCEMPDDRASRDALYAAKGIEPVSPRDMPSQWKTALSYANHLNTGGEKLSRAEEAKLIEPPDLSGVKSIRQMMDESGYRAA